MKRVENHMKRFIAFLMVLLLTLSFFPTVFAEKEEAAAAADTLHALGLFQGNPLLRRDCCVKAAKKPVALCRKTIDNSRTISYNLGKTTAWGVHA